MSTGTFDTGTFDKFVRLCAGRIGQVLNLQSLGNDAGFSHTTTRAWLSLLEASYILFILPPWYRNISKRLVKSPKLYFFPSKSRLGRPSHHPRPVLWGSGLIYGGLER